MFFKNWTNFSVNIIIKNFSWCFSLVIFTFFVVSVHVLLTLRERGISLLTFTINEDYVREKGNQKEQKWIFWKFGDVF